MFTISLRDFGTDTPIYLNPDAIVFFKMHQDTGTEIYLTTRETIRVKEHATTIDEALMENETNVYLTNTDFS